MTHDTDLTSHRICQSLDLRPLASRKVRNKALLWRSRPVCALGLQPPNARDDGASAQGFPIEPGKPAESWFRRVCLETVGSKQLFVRDARSWASQVWKPRAAGVGTGRQPGGTPCPRSGPERPSAVFFFRTREGAVLDKKGYDGRSTSLLLRGCGLGLVCSCYEIGVCRLAILTLLFTIVPALIQPSL